LSRGDGAQLRDAKRFLLYSLEKLAGKLKADVRLEEDAAHFAQSFLDVGFGEDSAPTKASERGLELFTELIKHSP
jgi:hypothetical protein